MDLIERYVKAVSGRLPAGQREEVEAELRSSILDALEGRGGVPDREDDVVPVLAELGDPATVAAAYHPRGEYLIGPELYPAFRRVLGMVLTAVVVVSGLGFVAEVVSTDGGLDFSVGDAVMHAINRGIEIGVMASLLVLVTFVLIQRGGALPKSARKEFDPRRLPALLNADRASRLDSGFELAISAVVLVVVGAIGGSAAVDGALGPPALEAISDSFVDNLTILVGSLLVEALVWAVVLVEGRWRVWTRAARTLSDVVAMVAFARFALVVARERAALEGVGLPPAGVTVLLLSLWITVATIAGVAFVRDWSNYRKRAAELGGRSGDGRAGPDLGPPMGPRERTARA